MVDPTADWWAPPSVGYSVASTAASMVSMMADLTVVSMASMMVDLTVE